jgi:Ca2+/Na+ antiporter
MEHEKEKEGIRSIESIEGVRFLRMPLEDAIEIILFTIFLAAFLGFIFHEKFLYIVFILIVVLFLYEVYHYEKKKKKLIKSMEAKLDELIRERFRERSHHKSL